MLLDLFVLVSFVLLLLQTILSLLSSMVYKLVIQFVVLLILNLDLFLKVMFLQVWYKLCLNDVIFLLSLVVILISAHQNLF